MQKKTGKCLLLNSALPAKQFGPRTGSHRTLCQTAWHPMSIRCRSVDKTCYVRTTFHTFFLGLGSRSLARTIFNHIYFRDLHSAFTRTQLWFDGRRCCALVCVCVCECVCVCVCVCVFLLGQVKNLRVMFDKNYCWLIVQSVSAVPNRRMSQLSASNMISNRSTNVVVQISS